MVVVAWAIAPIASISVTPSTQAAADGPEQAQDDNAENSEPEYGRHAGPATAMIHLLRWIGNAVDRSWGTRRDRGARNRGRNGCVGRGRGYRFGRWNRRRRGRGLTPHHFDNRLDARHRAPRVVALLEPGYDNRVHDAHAAGDVIGGPGSSKLDTGLSVSLRNQQQHPPPPVVRWIERGVVAPLLEEAARKSLDMHIFHAILAHGLDGYHRHGNIVFQLQGRAPRVNQHFVVRVNQFGDIPNVRTGFRGCNIKVDGPGEQGRNPQGEGRAQQVGL